MLLPSRLIAQEERNVARQGYFSSSTGSCTRGGSGCPWGLWVPTVPVAEGSCPRCGAGGCIFRVSARLSMVATVRVWGFPRCPRVGVEEGAQPGPSPLPPQVASSNGAGVGTFTYTNSATASDNL